MELQTGLMRYLILSDNQIEELSSAFDFSELKMLSGYLRIKSTHADFRNKIVSVLDN